MEVIKPGTIPLTTLVIIFIGLQIWWISRVLNNGREHVNSILNKDIKRVTGKEDPLRDQKEKLENLLKK